MTARLIIICGLFIMPVGLLFGQSDSVFVIPKAGEVIFDGRVDEPFWDLIDPVPMVQYEPNAGAPPTEKTEIRFAYDDVYFYGSIRAYDRDPDGIRATSLYRDLIRGSDHFEIVLDTYNDNENAYVFTTTPTGLRNDAAISNDATGGTISSGGWLNRDFNTFWDAESTVTDEGWFAEMRIPFSSLRFQNVDGKVIMGLSVQRKIARKLERLVFPAIPPKTDWAFLRPSLIQKVEFQGIQPVRKLYVTPYILGGYELNNELNQLETGYESKDSFQKEIGGDIKFSISNNLTADFTINTDFAQAEADDQLVNLTRFSLFFPEKRQFFQERASVFDFRTGGLSRLFFSRRIGLTNDGQQVPIYGGVRLIGRMKTWDLGFMNMQTQSLDSIPTENFGVVRVRKRVFNQNSFVGGMFTSRIDNRGNKNLAYGIDGLIRLFGDDYLTVQWAQTFDSLSEDGGAERFKSGRLALDLNRRRRRGFGYNIGTILSGPNYNPGVGFVDRNDFKFVTIAPSYTWLMKESPFIWHKIEAVGNTYVSNSDQQVLSAEIGPEWSFSRRNLDGGDVGVKWVYESLTIPLKLSDEVSIPVGDYEFYRLSAAYRIAGDNTLSAGLEVETGSFYDGWLNSLAFTPRWYLSKHFQLNLEYVYSDADFKERNEKFQFHITRLRIGTAVNRKISTNALVQYNSSIDLFSANVRFRYNFREGQDLWVVLNTGMNTNRTNYFPELPAVDSQSILVKYLHTFIF